MQAIGQNFSTYMRHSFIAEIRSDTPAVQTH